MQELYELKEMLMEELEKYGQKELTAGSLEVVDKLAHSLKNICKIMEEDEGGSYYDGSYEGGSYDRGGSYRGGSYENRGGRGSYARRRDFMGRYSRNYSRAAEDMVHELKDMMKDAPDDKTRQEFQRFIQKLER